MVRVRRNGGAVDSSWRPYKAETYTAWEGRDAMFRKTKIASGSGSNKSRADEIYVRRVRNITVPDKDVHGKWNVGPKGDRKGGWGEAGAMVIYYS